MGPVGMSSPPGQSLLVVPHPSPSSQPQGFAKMVSCSPPRCPPLCHLPWAARERVTKGACLRPAQRPGVPITSGCSPDAPGVSWEPGPDASACSAPWPCEAPHLHHGQAFSPGPLYPKITPPLPTSSWPKAVYSQTSRISFFFFLIKNVANVPCEPVRCTQENNEEKQALAVSVPREQLLSSGQMSCLLSLKNRHTCSAYTIQYCSYFCRLWYDHFQVLL